MSKTFIDSNIPLYAQDPRDPRKQATARDLLKRHLSDSSGVLSTQVLQEFYVIATKRFLQEPLRAKAMVRFLQSFAVVVVSPALVEDAIDIQILNRLSFWDALIVAAAKSAHCESLLTEDLGDGQLIAGVRVINPF